MERFIKGDIVIIPFPYTDLTQSKKRPALIVAELEGDDVILCQITSQKKSDKYAISINDEDLESGTLRHKSNIRPNRIVTADKNIILYKAGKLKVRKLHAVTDKIVDLIKS